MVIGFDFQIDDGPFQELNTALNELAGSDRAIRQSLGRSTRELDRFGDTTSSVTSVLGSADSGISDLARSAREMQRNLRGVAGGLANSTDRLSDLGNEANETSGSLRRMVNRFNVDNITSGLRSVETRLTSVGNNITDVSRRAKGVGKSLTKYLTLPAVGAATALAGITIKKGFDRLVGIDDAKAKLSGLGHDAKNISSIMDSALTSVKGTSFAMDQAVTTAANAVAAGVNQGKDLTRYLTITGDAAAIAGSDMAEMGEILNKVTTANKAYNGELQQLSDRGLPIYQWIADEANVAAGAVAIMAKEGDVSSELLLRAIEKNIGGAAKEMGNKSLTAAMANMWAAVGRLGASFLDAGGKGGGFFSQLKPLIGEITTNLDTMGDVAENAGRKFGAMFAGAIEKVRSIKAWYDDLSPVTQGIVKKLTLIGTVAAVSLGPLLIGLATFGFLIGNIFTGIGAVVRGIGFLLPYFTKLTTSLKVMLGFLTALSAPVWITIGAIVALGTAFVLFWKHSETFRNAILSGWSAIKNATKATVDFVISVTSVMWNGTVAGFIKVGEVVSVGWNSMKGATKTSAAYIASVTTAMWDSTIEGAAKAGNFGKAIIEGFSNTFASMGNYFVDMGEKIVTHIAVGMNSKVGQLISGFFNQLKSSFSDVSNIVSMLAPTVTGIGLSLMGVSGPIGFVITAIVSLVGFLYRLSKTNADVRNVFISVWQNIKDVFSSVVTAFEPIIEVYKDTFSSMMSELKPEFLETGQVIMQSFSELKPVFKELSGAFGELGNAVGASVMEIGKEFKKILPAVLPAIKEFAKAWITFQLSTLEVVMTLGKTVLPFLLEVAKQILPMIAKLVELLASTVLSLLKSVAEMFMSIAKAVLPVFLSIIKLVFTIALQIIKAVVPLVIELISALATVVVEIAKAVLPLLLSVVKSVFSIIGKIIKAAVPIITAIIASLVPVIMEIAKVLIPLILSVVKTVFPMVLSIIRSVIPIITSLLKVVAFIITKVLIPAIKFVLEVVKIVFPLIVNVIKHALNIVIGIINFFTALFKGDWQGLWDSVVLILKSVWGIIESVIKTAIDLVILTVKTGWNLIKNVTAAVFTGIWNFIKSIFGSIFTSISNFLSNIVGDVKAGWQTAKDHTVTLVSDMKTAVTDRFSSIVDAAKALPGRIGTGIKKAAGDAMKGVKELNKTMVEGLAKGVNGVGKGINWVFKRIGVEKRIEPWVPEYARGTGHHPGGPAIVGDGGMPELIRTPSGEMGLSPSTDTLVNLPRGTEVLSGSKTATLMNSGVPAYDGGTGGWMSDVLDSAQGLASKTGKSIKNATGTAVNKTKDVAGAAWDKGKSAAGSAKDLAIDVWDYASDPAKLMDTVWGKIGANFPTMKGSYGDMGVGAIKMIKDKAISYVGDKLAMFGGGDFGGINFGGNFVRTSGFGPRWGTNHNGVDYAAPIGTPIPSQTGGRVIFSGFGMPGSGYGGYGQTVHIDGGNGLSYLYGHNSKNMVSTGQTVSKGQIIGLVGSTGQSTGPHVHFEVRRNGQAVNPDNFGGFSGGGAGAPSGNLKSWIVAGMNRAGVLGSNWMNGLGWIAQKESSGNPRAVGAMTSTGTAKGLMQLKDMNMSGNPFDPVNNIVNGIRYIKQRYGTIEGALAFWRKNNWYKNGTNNAAGGLSVLGDGGMNELFQLPNGMTGMSPDFPTLMNLPKGSKVLSGNKTKQRMDRAQSATTATTAVRTGGGNNYEYNFQPVIQVTIEGGNNDVEARVKQSVKEQVQEQMREFFAMMNAKNLREG